MSLAAPNPERSLWSDDHYAIACFTDLDLIGVWAIVTMRLPPETDRRIPNGSPDLLFAIRTAWHAYDPIGAARRWGVYQSYAYPTVRPVANTIVAPFEVEWHYAGKSYKTFKYYRHHQPQE